MLKIFQDKIVSIILMCLMLRGIICQGKLRPPENVVFSLQGARLADLAKLVSQGLEAVYTLYVNPTKILQKILPCGTLAKKKQKGNIHNLDVVAASQLVALFTEIYICEYK